MDTLSAIGSLAGLAFASGLRLYATVLAVGVAIRLGWLVPPPHLAQLDVLASPWILGIAGVAFLVEFVADKVPWVDSAWDAVHSFIRPVGAAVLAATAIGDVHPVVEAGAVLLTGGIALSSHAAKATTRIVANHSPEPVTNAGLSLGEDALVLGGVWLALAHPLVALALVLVAVALILWFVPKLLRVLRAQWARVGKVVGR